MPIRCILCLTVPDICRCGAKKFVHMKRRQKEGPAEASRPGQMHSSDEGCTSQCTCSGQKRGQGLRDMHWGRVGSLDHPWLSCQTMQWVLSLLVQVHGSQYRGLHLSEHRQRSSYLARISPTCFLRGLTFNQIDQSSVCWQSKHIANTALGKSCQVFKDK